MGSASSGSGRLGYEELEPLVAEQAALIDALQARITEQAAVIEELERRVQAEERLTEGLVFTIEPMLTAGSTRLEMDRDGWTVRTRDGSLSAHEEHTIMVAAGGPLVLTAI